jgi:FKBP-type peptidyl-prolyl cis-trans isomerase (trigger factor)
MTENHETIDALQWEKRTFAPSEVFKKNSLVVGTHLYDEANVDYESFWARQASDLVTWQKPWDTVCEWELPFSKWFVGGQLNVSYNCLDRHVLAGKGDKVAIHFEGEPGDSRTVTYAQLLDEVQKFANVLKGLGVQKGDRVNLDFKGEIDGVPFTGGSSENYAFVLGDGSMLKEFDEAAVGMKADETKTFPMKFPDDYHGKDVAGKLAMFTIKIRNVSAPKVPALDEEFAKSMGIVSGDIGQLKEDVRKNLAREVANRCKAKTKTAVMDALSQWANFEIPKSLVEGESQRLAESTRQDMAARGMNVKDVPIPADLFAEQASKRVKLGLLVGEIVKAQNLHATEAQLKAFVQDMASAYEKPEAFVNWFMTQQKQRAEAEAMVIEDNVVSWALASAKISDQSVSVEGLMAESAQS